ncbi:MAG: Nif3-like dinuclear metal center hexameric protein [Spiroplasma sp.]
MKLLDIITKLDSVFPIADAANWDNVGWQIKSKNIDIDCILVAIDVTESVINEAIKANIKLIIVHHPFIFDFTDIKNSKWKKILYDKLIKNNINIYVLHTNFDKNINGMSFLIAQDLKLNNIKYFDSDKFSVSGWYDDLSLRKVITLVKSYFGFEQIKVITNNLATKINKVVLAPGAGGNIIELINKEKDSTVSLLITGEMKWHQELEARDKDINVLILGHNMEEKFVNFISMFLLEHFNTIKIKKYFFQQTIFI